MLSRITTLSLHDVDLNDRSPSFAWNGVASSRTNRYRADIDEKQLTGEFCARAPRYNCRNREGALGKFGKFAGNLGDPKTPECAKRRTFLRNRAERSREEKNDDSWIFNFMGSIASSETRDFRVLAEHDVQNDVRNPKTPGYVERKRPRKMKSTSRDVNFKEIPEPHIECDAKCVESQHARTHQERNSQVREKGRNTLSLSLTLQNLPRKRFHCLIIKKIL